MEEETAMRATVDFLRHLVKLSIAMQTARYGAKNAKPCSPAMKARGREIRTFMVQGPYNPNAYRNLKKNGWNDRIIARRTFNRAACAAYASALGPIIRERLIPCITVSNSWRARFARV